MFIAMFYISVVLLLYMLLLSMYSACFLLEWLFPCATFVNLFPKGRILIGFVIDSICLFYYLLHLVALVVLFICARMNLMLVIRILL